MREKAIRRATRALYERWAKFFPQTPLPIRLPFGAWWLVRNDYMGRTISGGHFENAEYAFVTRFLQPGMTVLDVGAHHGFYTLLASKRVGPEGRVVSFEPSPRERNALLAHLRLNRASNVSVESVALGCEESESELFVVQGSQTGCNSLRHPAPDVPGQTSPIRVRVVTLDDWLAKQAMTRVDFVKLDAEGGELDVLRGAQQLLSRSPKPVLLIEVQDIRTNQWNYRAKEVIDFLREKGFTWFSLAGDGSARAMDADSPSFEGNFVACPTENIYSFLDDCASLDSKVLP